jgi:hypothetical protein
MKDDHSSESNNEEKQIRREISNHQVPAKDSISKEDK